VRVDPFGECLLLYALTFVCAAYSNQSISHEFLELSISRLDVLRVGKIVVDDNVWE